MEKITPKTPEKGDSFSTTKSKTCLNCKFTSFETYHTPCFLCILNSDWQPKQEGPKTPKKRESLSKQDWIKHQIRIKRFLRNLDFLKININYLNNLMKEESKQKYIITSIRGLRDDLNEYFGDK